MSTKPSRPDHLKLEPPATPKFEVTASLVAKRHLETRQIAFDHAINAGKSEADAADAAQQVYLLFDKRFRRNPDFLRDDEKRIAYTRKTVANLFKKQRKRERRFLENQGWIGALMEIHRDNGVEVSTEELIAEDEAAEAREARRLAWIRERMKTLPPVYQKAFEDRHIKGL